MFIRSSPDPECHIDASRNDHSTLLHTVAGPTTIIRKLDLPSFTGPLKAPVSIKGTLTEVPPTSTLKVDFRGGSFLGSLEPSPSLRLVLWEHPSALPSIGVGLAFASTVGDAILTMAYADPIPQWSKSLTVEATGGSVHITRLLEWSEAMMTPIAIALPGQIAAISSRIAWLRPKYAPTGLLRYSVFIQDATAPGDPITLWTTDTSVTLPDAVLTTGHHYTARITAKWSAQSVTFSSHPLDGNITEQASSSSDEFVF